MKYHLTPVVLLATFFLHACDKPASNVVGSSEELSSNEAVSGGSESVPTATPTQITPPASNVIAQADIPSDPDQPNPDDFAAGLPLKSAVFTPSAIRNYAFSRSKYWIRRTFGTPDAVDEGGDSWLFNADNPHMQVEDQDAGKRVYVRLHFRPPADGDAQERVVQVEVF